MRRVGWAWLVGVLACGGVSSDTAGGPELPGETETEPPEASEGTHGSTTEDASSESGTSTSSTSESSSGSDSTGSDVDDPKPQGTHDLDGDGVAESTLLVGACDDDASTCLHIDSPLTDTDAVTLWSGLPDCAGTVVGNRLDTLGDLEGSTLHEVHAAACVNNGTAAPPAVAVVDVDAAVVVALSVAPSHITSAWFEVARDPEGLGHSMLTPSYGDGGDVNAVWGALCLHRPDLPSDGVCGDGFARYPITLPQPYFREVGGTLVDLDDDGWDDVNLIYHYSVHTISLATGAPLASTTFDVALATEPQSPVGFHSGRNYGSHAAYRTASSDRLLIVGGAPLGTFEDYNCNVSRFVAMLESPAGSPGARGMAWSHYYGFGSTIFDTYSPAFVGNPAGDIARAADVMDGCVHRFSDSRSRMDGQDVVVFNRFSMDAPVDLCLDEQFDLYQDPPWTEEKADAWYDCFATNVGASGRWGMQVLRESDGAGLTGGQDVYLWGWSDALHPSGEVVYLVETFDGPGRFDLADRAPSALRWYTLEEGLFVSQGTAPVEGRPNVLRAQPTPALGQGASSFSSALNLHDRNADGLLDVEFEDGTWIGWDDATQAVVVRG